MGTNLERLHDSSDKEQTLLKREDEENEDGERDDDDELLNDNYLIERKRKECIKEETNNTVTEVEDDDDGGDIIHDSSFRSSALSSSNVEPETQQQGKSTKKLLLSRVKVSSSSSVACASEESNPSDEEDDGDDDGDDNDGEEKEEKTLSPPPPPPLGLYLSPIHHHSFQSLDNNILPNFPLLWRRYKKCCICQSYFTDKKGLVKCVSCGCLAHRSCSFDVPEQFRDTMQTCAVNEKLLIQQQQQQQQKEENCCKKEKDAEEEQEVILVVADDNNNNASLSTTTTTTHQQQQPNDSIIQETTTTENNSEATPTPQQLPQPKSIFGKICVSWRSDSTNNIPPPTPPAEATTTTLAESPDQQPIAHDSDGSSSPASSFEIHPNLSFSNHASDAGDDNALAHTTDPNQQQHGDNTTDQTTIDPTTSSSASSVDNNQNNDNTDVVQIEEEKENEAENEEIVTSTTRSFASVATTLQENVLLLFDNNNRQKQQPQQEQIIDDYEENNRNKEQQQEEEVEGDEAISSKDDTVTATPSLSKQSSFSISGLAAAIGIIKGDNDNHSNDNQQPREETENIAHDEEEDEDVKGILQEVDPKPPPPTTTTPPSLLQTTYEISQISRTTKSRMGMASVAGGIAGGVAGLIISGPVGAIALSKICQTAGVVSVLLDGTVSVGVLMASATAAKIAVDQVQKSNAEMMEGGGKRMIALNYNKTVMLVRPNVIIDPIWLQYTEEAKLHRANNKNQNQNNNNKRSFNNSLGQLIILNHQAKVADEAKRKRNAVDADIVYSNEDEIPTEEKVLLIVSRSLNDRLSLPGHVHGWLIQKCKERAVNASAALGNAKLNHESMKINDNEEKEKKKTMEGNEYQLVENNDDCTDNGDDQDQQQQLHSRERRQDAHGVIKHVTATLLEVRPGLGATPRLTELTATAVEALVFGELYDLVFAEIEEEMREKDATLMKKISEFEMNHYMKRRRQHQQQQELMKNAQENEEGEDETGSYPITGENISVGALEALLNIPEARTPVDKLAYCVQFLETISAHFSDDINQDEGTTDDQNDIQREGGEKDENIENNIETTKTTRKKKKKRSGAEVMGADSLLKMVCEHIIVAKVPRLNAELVFLEEFARDEQLLRGKEGYSLVTLQASLHFLNASSDFDEDIFKNED